MVFHEVWQKKKKNEKINERISSLDNTVYSFSSKIGKREDNFNGVWQILTILM